MNEETKPHSVTAERDDSGLIAYATILALHRIPVDPNQLRHSVGHNRAIDADDLKRIAKRQDDVRAKSVRSDWTPPLRRRIIENCRYPLTDFLRRGRLLEPDDFKYGSNIIGGNRVDALLA